MPGRLSAGGPAWEGSPQAAVLVPVKAFRHAKVRLAAALPFAQRAALARAMAARVLAAASPLPVAVVCDDDEVATWAGSLGARVIWEPGRGLNRAVASGVAHLAAEGVTQVTVAHADLPLAADLASVGLVASGGGASGAGASDQGPGPEVRDLRLATLVPDRRLDGTNVLSVPTRSGFGFAYGPGSFWLHVVEALRLDLALQVLRRPQLAWDIDVPSDLTGLTGLTDLTDLTDLTGPGTFAFAGGRAAQDAS
ncbi:MAG: NTP transferase domain-containing protein [Acidimicrobiales bacterium]